MKRAHKFGAKRTTVDGITFASQAEAKRYAELKLLVAAGEIRALKLQPRYALTVNGTKIGNYVADFEYEERFERRQAYTNKPPPTEWLWHRIAEDVKGFPTPVYRLKSKHFRAEYKAIELREVKA